MKNVFYILSLSSFLLLSFNIKAQVGIMTEDPKTTFHVQSSNNMNVPDGIKPPVLTKQELANKASGVYSTDQAGAIVYVNDITGGTSGTSLSQVTNIKKKGNYRFDGIKWISMETPSNSEYALYDIIRIVQPAETNFTNNPPASGYAFIQNAYYNLDIPTGSLVVPANSQILCVFNVNYNIAYSLAMMSYAQSNALLNNLVVGTTINIVDPSGTALGARAVLESFQTTKFKPNTSNSYWISTVSSFQSNSGEILLTNNTSQDINATVLVTGYYSMFNDYYANSNFAGTVAVLTMYKKDL